MPGLELPGGVDPLGPGMPAVDGIGLLLPGELLDELGDELLLGELLDEELLDEELLDEELLDEELLDDEELLGEDGGDGVCGVVGLLALGQPVSSRQQAELATARSTPFDMPRFGPV